MLVVERAGGHVINTQNFNFLGIFGWWLNACLLKRKTMGKSQIGLFNRLVPLLATFENKISLPGLSIIQVSRVK